MKVILLASLFITLSVRVFSNEIPLQWANDMTLTLQQFGGHLPYLNEVVIEKRGHHRFYANGENQFTALFFTDYELNGILETLHKWQFVSIKTVSRTSIEQGNPTHLIRLSWNSGRIDICSNATNQISQNDLDNYLEINTYLINLLKEKGVTWCHHKQ